MTASSFVDASRGQDLSLVEDSYPLAPLQQGMLFHTLYAPHSGLYIEQGLFAFHEPLQEAAFVQAVRHLTARHPILRTRFRWDGRNEPRQEVCRHVRDTFTFQDWRALSAVEQDRRWVSLLEQDRRQGFDLSEAPLHRLLLIQLKDADYTLLWTLHHTIVDLRSILVLVRELFTIYEMVCQGQTFDLPLTRPFREYVDWLQHLDWTEAEAFWRNLLRGFTTPTSLLVDAEAQDSATLDESLSASQEIYLSETTTIALRKLARRSGLTVNILFQGAWALVLSQYSRETDIVFGVTHPVEHSTVKVADSMVGLLLNVLPARTIVSPDAPLIPWLRELGAQWKATRGHEHTSLLQIQQWSEIPPGTTLLTSLVTFQNFDANMFLQASGGQWARREFHFLEKSNYPLTIKGTLGTRLRIQIEYHPRRVDAATAMRVAKHLQAVLEGMVRHPEALLGEISLLTEAERQQVLVEWNETRRDYPAGQCVHQLFAAQVERTPDAVAVVDEGQTLTYRALNTRANQLAHYLRRHGVGSEVLVGLCIERSVDMVVGVLGILKAGGAYVPLDPTYPSERLQFMLKDAQPLVVLTQQSLRGRVPMHGAQQTVCLDTAWAEIAQEATSNPESGATAETLAYVLYTSGSTGTPKGVQIPHRALSNFLYAMGEQPGMGSHDTLLAVTTLSFDIAALELFLPLTVGARLVLVSREVTTDEQLLQKHLASSGATVMQATPSTWRMLIDGGWAGNPQLKMLCGGEALTQELARELLLRGSSLWNLYGPTEATIWSTLTKVETGERTPVIGRPLANTQLYILNPHLQPVPIGVPGELHIGGAGLARGYLNRPELTAEKFISHAFDNAASQRLYRTGDRARYLPDGNVEFLGRLDQQVKLRGFRIELGEIEAVLRQHPGIRDTIAVIREDTPGDKRLVAYLACSPGDVPTVRDLRSLLQSKLPDYMVPSAFVFLDQLPLTPNGKLDRRALPPALTHSEREQAFVAPCTAEEEVIANLWTQVLGLEQVGIHDNFFELGGHSLKAMQVVTRLATALHAELPLRALFEAPTVAGLAEKIRQTLWAKQARSFLPLVPVSRTSALPLSFAQQRLWFLDQLEPNSATYNIPVAVRLQGSLNTAAFHQALNALVARHDILRTNFAVSDDGDPRQVIADQLSLPFPVIDLQTQPETQRELEASRLAQEEAQRPFDLACEPLIRTLLVRLDAEVHLFVVTFHHIISDGWSISVFFRELSSLYKTLATESPSLQLPLPIQYADFAAWQQQWLQGEVLTRQVTYWQQRLAEAPSCLSLPTDRPRPAKQTYNGAHYSFILPAEATAALKRLSQQEGTTLFMILLAAFQVLLFRYTGQDDLVVGSPIANRSRFELEGLIGFFVNILALRIDLSGDLTFQELLQRVKDACLGAYAHQDLPFEKLVEELPIQRDLSYSPVFQTFFALQNVPSRVMELPGLTTRHINIDNQTAKFDLSMYLWEDETTHLTGVVEYNTDLFDQATITRLVGHYQTLLEDIINNPNKRIATLTLLKPSERQQVLVEWNETRRDYPPEQGVPQLFATQVERTPEAVAVVYDGQHLTYRALNTRANQLAHYLQRRGVGPEVLVGLCVERSVDMVVGLLGILKAGGAYVPLDPTYPPERLQFMVSDAQPLVMLTQHSLLETVPAHGAQQTVCLDTDWAEIAQEATSNPESGATAETLAYVLYTSGSTGTPKGVLGLQRGLLNRFSWMWETYPFVLDEVCCQKTSLNFVDSLWEILGPLLQGVPLVIVPERSLKDPALLVQTLAQQRVTRLVLVPSLLRILLELFPDLHARLPHLRVWITSGEALTLELARKFQQQLPQRTLLNLYGSSEVSADVTWSETQSMSPTGMITIGRPIANTQIYILDAHRQPVPIGVVGEIYVGGTNLARGYLNQPALTAERFIPHFLHSELSARLYKTGDLARYLPDGNIEFVGRIDNQVKIRGFRVELGEIESVLLHYRQVREAVVLAWEKDPGDKRLVGYVVSDQQNSLTPNELRKFLEEKLPAYMVPSVFVLMDALPLTPNGKIDRRSLPAPSETLGDPRQVVAPEGYLAIQIAKIWEEALGIRLIGITDNFFALGGNSLLAVRVVTQISKTLGTELPLATFFQAPTIEQLTNLFRQQGWRVPSSLLVPVQRRGNKPPFFCVFGWIKLARYVAPDQPFYTFRPYGYDGVPSPSSVEAMANGYLKEMRTLQPQGPYYVGGHSFGGVVAFEMAQQLRRQGQEVALLALMDPPAIWISDKASLVANHAINNRTPLIPVSQVQFRLNRHWEQALRLNLSQRARWLWNGILERTHTWFQFALCQVYLGVGRSIPPSLRPAYVTANHYRALRSYRAQPHFGHALLFVTSERSSRSRAIWESLLTRGLEIREASGTHMGMFEEEHLQSWAPHFAAALQRAQTVPTAMSST